MPFYLQMSKNITQQRDIIINVSRHGGHIWRRHEKNAKVILQYMNYCIIT